MKYSSQLGRLSSLDMRAPSFAERRVADPAAPVRSPGQAARNARATSSAVRKCRGCWHALPPSPLPNPGRRRQRSGNRGAWIWSPVAGFSLGGRLRHLLRAEDAVASVAQAGDDVGVLVQALVDGAGVDAARRVGGEHGLDALGAATSTMSLMFFTPCLRRYWMAATAEPPVASMGSTTSTSRCAMLSGSLA